MCSGADRGGAQRRMQRPRACKHKSYVQYARAPRVKDNGHTSVRNVTPRSVSNAHNRARRTTLNLPIAVFFTTAAFNRPPFLESLR